MGRNLEAIRRAALRKQEGIVLMGKFTAIGMREVIPDHDHMVINTCSGNDTSELGTINQWSWANPTNTKFAQKYLDVFAVSVECLWQGCKVFENQDELDVEILCGNWRKNKGRKPIGAYAGSRPLIKQVTAARQEIYLPAYLHQLTSWMKNPKVQGLIKYARSHRGNVYLRDFDTGRGISNSGPMSHAWVLAMYLNTGEMPNK